MRRLVVAFCLLGTLAACSNLGPVKLGRDRLEYSESVAGSWKRQTLLNIVKQRYLDLPVFMDVSGIVAGYQVEANANLLDLRLDGSGNGAIGGGLRYTDRPTISYKVLTGRSFTHALMTPLPPATVFFFMQSGWPADFIFEVLVDEANGVRNASGSIEGFRPAEPGFLQVLRLLRLVQREGGVGFTLRHGEGGKQFVRFHFRRSDSGDALRRAVRELLQSLGVPPDTPELELVFGGLAERPDQLALRTRSVLEVISVMARHIRLPEDEMTQGRAIAGRSAGTAGDRSPASGNIDIRHGAHAPEDAFVAVPYRNQWYWIDDTDLLSKRSFTFLMLILAMAESDSGSPPTLTIPVQ